MNHGRLYRTIWRWHFYAGLFVLPFILILSLTGSVYLFKPQTDRWEERAYRHLSLSHAVSPDQQVSAALAAYPGAGFQKYRLPENPGDAALIELAQPAGKTPAGKTLAGKTLDVFVSPQGQVVGSLSPDSRISNIVSKIHGTLLLGKWGDWLIELAASWTIMLILSGLYLWWPRPFRLAGTIWPRPYLKGRPLLKDIHRVIGFWVAGFVLVLLISGLPWAGAWGSAFKWVRAEMGWVKGTSEWKIGTETTVADEHAGHDHMAMQMSMPSMSMPSSLPLSLFVQKAQNEHLVYPVVVLPPYAPQSFGPANDKNWLVKSETQNRPLARQISYDPVTGNEVARSGFADKHALDRLVGTFIAWHEGQLFGWINQLIGLMTAIALITVSVLGTLMWLKRRPVGTPINQLSAPPPVPGVKLGWVIAFAVGMGLLLPLFGLSLLVIFAVDLGLGRFRRRV
ncbi:MAG: PepSY domain-containing protein [Asticcacaulis sp.]